MADYIEEKYNYEFIEIIVEYMSGRPYYSIKYLNKDDGKIHIGYSSYKLECISEFLREYFMPSIDAVEVVRCKDCVYWQDDKIQIENGEYRDYLPDEKPFVTIDKGINVGAHCTLHGFENMSGSWFWAQANDFCSRGVKKNEIN